MTDQRPVHSANDNTQEGYPKLVVRMMAACYQYRGLPETVSTEDEMLAHALGLSSELGLKVCLVLGPRRAWYCEPNGAKVLSDQPPRGGTRPSGGEIFFVCADGAVHTGSPRGPIARRVEPGHGRA